MLVEEKDTVGEDVPIFITCIGVMHTTIKRFFEDLHIRSNSPSSLASFN